ncbi:MAG: sulfotransferase [Acidobacteriaceae bacterium]
MTFQEVNWPNFFVVGAPKAGTSSVYSHLKKHPQVFLPDNKEPRYFSPQARDRVTLEEYRRLYGEAGGFVAVGDMSPCYLLDEGAPRRIHEVSPEAKIIVMLRDPVARAWSDFLFCRALGTEPEVSFREVLRRYDNREAKEWYLSRLYIEQGLYADQVRRYQETFGIERVLVLLFDDLSEDPRGLFSRLASHIGVDAGFFESADLSEPYNQYRMPKRRSLVEAVRSLGLQTLLPRPLLRKLRPLFFDMKKPSLDSESRRLLQDLYDPDVTRLEEFLGRKIPELRRSWA